MITSTLPALLYAAMVPVFDSATVTWFGVGAPPAIELRFEVTGRGASGG